MAREVVQEAALPVAASGSRPSRGCQKFAVRLELRADPRRCGRIRAPPGLKQVSESMWEEHSGPVLLGTLDEREAKPQHAGLGQRR